MINELTPEQEALMPIYLEKWRKIALSTERINQNKAAETVRNAYIFIDYEQPEIFFLDSPYAVYNFLQKSLKPELIEIYINGQNGVVGLWLDYFYTDVFDYLEKRIERNADHQLNSHFYLEEISFSLRSAIICSITDIDIEKCGLTAEFYYDWLAKSDFCFSVLNLVHPPQQWEIFKSLVQECGWIFAYDDICIVCDRPLHLRFDNQNRLHAEGEPAIQFTDGYSLYFYHGVALPGAYGKVHPREWQSQWLLTQDNAELRRVLIQGIGYTRICVELQARELDIWQEYTFLQIDNPIDVEQIYLLKMTFPSTGFIHVLRVPPDTNSARESIRWVNWGIDPEDFAVQT